MRRPGTYVLISLLVAAHSVAFAPAQDTEPTIAITPGAGGARVDFTGLLLGADGPQGPWSVLTNVTSPHWVEQPCSNSFFMASPPFSNSIFSSASVIRLDLTGPMQAHFELAFAGTPDGIFPPVRQKPWFDGTVSIPALAVSASVRVRGNSSLQECPFPKLKFKVSSLHRLGTPYAEAREIDVGTHCAEGGRGSIGRLRHESAVYREVMAYEVLNLLGFTAPKVRRARIEYHDSTPPTNSSAVAWTLTRDASLIEDIEVIASRLGGRALSDEELGSLAGSLIAPQLLVDIQAFNALLGNWDYSLDPDRVGVWNMEVLEFTLGTNVTFVPVPGDFDLSSWVTELPRRRAPYDYYPELPDVDREVQFELERIRRFAGSAAFEQVRNRFAVHRAQLQNLVLQAQIDEEGRANALSHVDAFYRALEGIR